MNLRKNIFTGGLCLLIILGIMDQKVVANEVQSKTYPFSIKYGKDRCAQCGMFIKDARFAASISTEDKKILNFDDIGDMLIYYHNSTQKPVIKWVHDYHSSNNVPTEEAFFVLTDKILTPMRHGIIAFASEEEALKMQKKVNGQYFSTFSVLYNYFLKETSLFQKTATHYHNFGQIPIGIMGGHNHQKGSLMLSYRLMYMKMQNIYKDSGQISNDDVWQNYSVAPQNMDMYMHMAGIMYSLTNNLTLMAMFPFLSQSMQLSMKMMPDHSGMENMNKQFSTLSQGLSDIKLNALYSFWSAEKQNFIANIGLSLPGGNINAKSDTPMASNQQMPYPMQLGSGTFDLLAGLTYTGALNSWNWGSQLSTTLRLGKNSNNYTLGNNYNLTAWMGKNWWESLQTSLRLNFLNRGNISGQDSLLISKMSPAADPSLQGGSRIDVIGGLNINLPAIAGNNILGFELGIPVFQSLYGPQLGTSWYINSGIQFVL